MAAGPRYSSSVLINNWSEDQSARDLAAKDYEAKRSRGDLTHLKKAREKAFQTQPVPHSFSEDGLVRYGQHLQLQIAFPPSLSSGSSSSSRSAANAYALSCNIFEQPQPGFIRVTAASTAPGHTGSTASARNVFVLEPSSGLNSAEGKKKEGQPLRYGDRVSLACNPTLTVNLATRVVSLPFLLHSTRPNNITGAGRRGRQECDMTTSRSSDTEWIVSSVTGDPLSSVGEEVHVGEPFVLNHSMTNTALAADPSITSVGDFGVELDCHLNNYRSTNHSSMNHSGELPLAPALPQNQWCFVASDSPEAGVDDRGFIPISPAALVDKARAMILGACSIHGLRSLSVALSAMDQRGTGILPSADVRVALFEHGVRISADEFSLLLGQFEESQRAISGGGFISIQKLLQALRGDYYSRSRQAIVDAAYDHLKHFKALGKLPRNTYLGGVAAPGLKGLSETTGTIYAPPAGGVHAPPPGARGGGHHAPPAPAASLGSSTKRAGASDPDVITADELKFAFDAKFDPRAVAKVLTPVEAAFEFSRQWPEQIKPSDPVTLESFHRYYQDVSALIGDDDFEFNALVANVWHVPGHGSWKTKASKRVMVTFHKGTSTEVVVPEAEDIPDDDFEGLCTALKALGFGGIARVKVLEVIEVE